MAGPLPRPRRGPVRRGAAALRVRLRVRRAHCLRGHVGDRGVPDRALGPGRDGLDRRRRRPARTGGRRAHGGARRRACRAGWSAARQLPRSGGGAARPVRALPRRARADRAVGDRDVPARGAVAAGARRRGVGGRGPDPAAADGDRCGRAARQPGDVVRRPRLVPPRPLRRRPARRPGPVRPGHDARPARTPRTGAGAARHDGGRAHRAVVLRPAEPRRRRALRVLGVRARRHPRRRAAVVGRRPLGRGVRAVHPARDAVAAPLRAWPAGDRPAPAVPARARRHYFSLASLEETEPITRQMLRDAKNSPFAPKEAADV